MRTKSRLHDIENSGRGERTAHFTIYNGRATGSAWWKKGLRWENLTRPEYEKLVEALQEDGVKIMTLDICRAISKTESVSGWDWQTGEKSETPEGNSDEAPELT